ncbi:MAG: methyltransferase [Wenzhouxiangellaceae bacterium]|nr:methyltransferase [Wenzhouxiangellaceae bacterium]
MPIQSRRPLLSLLPFLAVMLCLPLAPATATAQNVPALSADVIQLQIEAVLAAEHRSPENRQRDRFRNPAGTLAFLGWQPGMAIAEIWPAGGWYTEILAPLTRKRGQYFAAGFAMTADRTPQWRKDYQKQFAEKLEATPAIYDHIVSTELSIPERPTFAPPASLDMVLTFRNVHNWVNGDYAPAMFSALYRALKPGGILGLVEHRAAPGTPRSEVPDQGYMTEQHVIELAESAGFVLEEKSEINANPDDTRDHPEGVWSLPPSYRGCRGLDEDEMNACIERFRPIGESDRMTMRFRKP